MATRREKFSFAADWRFWFKIVFIVLLTFAIIYNYADGMNRMKSMLTLQTETVNGKETKTLMYTWAIYGADNKVIAWDYLGYTIYFFSFFTIQSNILVLVWFICAAVVHNNEKTSKVTNPYFSIGVATFISITSLIFNFMLMPSAIKAMTQDQYQVITGIDNNWTPLQDDSVKFSSKYSAIMWIVQEILHTVGPIGLVLYVTLFLEKENIKSMKEYWKQISWKMILYPLAYGVYILVRGELRFRSGRPDNTWYPYFFLNIHKDGGQYGWPINGVHISGVVWLIIGITAIAAIAIGFSALYNFAYLRLKDAKLLKKTDVEMTKVSGGN